MKQPVEQALVSIVQGGDPLTDEPCSGQRDGSSS